VPDTIFVAAFHLGFGMIFPPVYDLLKRPRGVRQLAPKKKYGYLAYVNRGSSIAQLGGHIPFIWPGPASVGRWLLFFASHRSSSKVFLSREVFLNNQV
jgi:hypothetical protein